MSKEFQIENDVHKGVSTTKRQSNPPPDAKDWSGRDWKNWAETNWKGKDWKNWAETNWKGKDGSDTNWLGKDWATWTGTNWTDKDWKNKDWKNKDWKNKDWTDKDWTDTDWKLSDFQDITKSQVKRVQDAKDSSPSGVIVDFSNSITININVGISPNNQPDFTTQLTGATKILFGKPKDAIVGDPLLGNVGQVDGKFDVSRTELVSTNSVGSTPFSPQVTVRLGDGVADLAPTPSSPDVLLHSGGAVSRKPGHPIAADTFFNASLEIQDTPNGSLRNKNPITIKGDISSASFSNGQLKLNYGSSSVIPLYKAGPDGVFWTGDEIEVARLVPGANGNSLTVNLTSSSW